MRKLTLTLICMVFLAGTVLAVSGETSSPADVVKLKWQVVIDKDGKTCTHCGATEESLKKAMAMLEEEGVKAELEVVKKTVDDFSKSCSESNLVWVNGMPLNEVLNAEVGSAKCSGVCTTHKADAMCRTLVLDGKSFETIPPELIMKAGVMAQGKSAEGEAQQSSKKTLGCAKSCVKTCGEAAAAACAGAKKD